MSVLGLNVAWLDCAYIVRTRVRAFSVEIVCHWTLIAVRHVTSCAMVYSCELCCRCCVMRNLCGCLVVRESFEGDSDVCVFETCEMSTLLEISKVSCTCVVVYVYAFATCGCGRARFTARVEFCQRGSHGCDAQAEFDEISIICSSTIFI